MDLLPTEEQQQIVDTASAFLANELPVARLLKLPAGTSCLDDGQLSQLGSLGWLGISLREEHGGVGYGLPEEALLFAELGRHLVPPSVLASALAARLAAHSVLHGRVKDILAGDCRIALATARAGSGASVGPSTSGEFLVFEPSGAEFVLVAEPGCAALLHLDAMREVSSERCIDPTLDSGVWQADSLAAAAHLDAQEDDLFMRGALLVAALQLGIAEATLERSVNYAKEREQYGQAIGAFQAIKHYCANMAIRCESARSMLYHASITLGSGAAAGNYDTHSLKALADEGASENANTAVQIHGGMGYTQEMDIHLFVKRSQVLATLFGSRRFHLRQLLSQPMVGEEQLP